MNTNEEDLFANVQLQTPSNMNTLVKNVIESIDPSMLSSEWQD